MIPRQGMATAQTQVHEIEVRSADGTMLRGRWWRRPGPRGVVIVAHGFGEHGGSYRRVADALGSTLDLDVVAVDFRGHGKSPGRRGVVRHYDELTRDLQSVLDWASVRIPDVPQFLLGHSNGGQVVLRVALEGRTTIAGIIVSNPALRVSLPVPPSKLRFGRLLAKYAPWITLRGDLRSDLLTRDPEIQREHRADPLRHGRISAPLFFGMVEGGEMLIARAGEIRIPTLILVGGQDPVVNPAAAHEFYDRLGSVDKTLLIYPKMLHEPLNELGAEQVFDDVVRWIDSHLFAAD
jgi:alpha-beta hydrolase superfamily lysophospholipase